MATNTKLQNEVFLDTSYIIALSTPKDNHHLQAANLSKTIASTRPKLITSRGVLLEIGNSLSKVQYRKIGVAILNALTNDPGLEIIDVTSTLYRDALALYSSRPDKEWGLTDCLSFTIMEQRGIQQALTADEHFIQAGYQALIR
ncbi:MAG: PIN domain-containing protein [Capsulimonas sp.]|uniref:type II toxin-antitoxin system VapC family toxin n=1 Tax=Capsulimonas sp. TaxID=2494211 RepID=UPI00326336BB